MDSNEKRANGARNRKKQKGAAQRASGLTPNGNLEHVDSVTGVIHWKRHMEVVKAELLENIQGQMSEVLDTAMQEAVQSYTQRLKGHDAPMPGQQSRNQEVEKQKVFIERQSLLDELMEVEHFRTIYHMFVATLCVFILSTMAVDFIDEGRLIMDFDILFYTFGKFPTVVVSWLCMFLYTLLVPYKALQLWGGSVHTARLPWLLSTTMGLLLITCQTCVLGIYPIYVVIHHKLPPASSFIIVLEQIRFLMKSHSFVREAVPVVLRTKLAEGKKVKLPEFSSYLYFLFCPTLIYRDSYPRTPYIRWKYVAKNLGQFLGCLFYVYFILVTLCIPVFTNMSKQPFSTKTLVLSIFHATLPGTFVLLLSFFAFLHCWLNAFAEMLRFADRMFYKDWWNSTSFANYYRTWNVVVHDWLYNYMYRDFHWLLNKRFRTVAMLSVFLISAAVHEYVFIVSLGFFYPVMFCLFAIFGVLFNFILNDRRKSPVWNVIMWTFLFIGQGIQVCLYCQEWYAQIHCPLKEKTFWGLVTPRSWSCRI
ncbi:sterol O-acyltransferase 2 [Pleurodeles waltl]